MTYDAWKTTPPAPDGHGCELCRGCEARDGSNYCSESCATEAAYQQGRRDALDGRAASDAQLNVTLDLPSDTDVSGLLDDSEPLNSAARDNRNHDLGPVRRTG